MPSVQPLSLSDIDIYGGTQTRVATSDEAIASYAEEMERGTDFPPIIVFFDGTKHWLADGFHRFLAARRYGAATIPAEILEGGRTDALIFALGANDRNGLFRSSGDKRNAVEIALEEWPDHSNNVVAELCKVSADLVRKCRNQLVEDEKIPDRKTVRGKDGKQYPAKIERQPRGESGGGSGGGGGGGGGAMSKKAKREFAQSIPIGGGDPELEAEARAMVRRGEISPAELDNIKSATAFDYVETAISVLERIKPEDSKRSEALARLSRWLSKQDLTSV